MKHFIITSILLFSLICNKAYSQKKQTSIDSTELQRITNVINVSGDYLYKSGQQQLNAWTLMGLGTAIAVGNAFIINEPIAMYIGLGVTVSSIPLLISSAINKRNSGEKLRDFHLAAPLNTSITKNPKPDVTTEKQNTTKVKIRPETEPKHKVGQVVYFYRKGLLTEAKITFIDTIGLKVEYVDSDKTKTKYIAFDKVLLEKP